MSYKHPKTKHTAKQRIYRKPNCISAGDCTLKSRLESHSMKQKLGSKFNEMVK